MNFSYAHSTMFYYIFKINKLSENKQFFIWETFIQGSPEQAPNILTSVS